MRKVEQQNAGGVATGDFRLAADRAQQNTVGEAGRSQSTGVSVREVCNPDMYHVSEVSTGLIFREKASRRKLGVCGRFPPTTPHSVISA